MRASWPVTAPYNASLLKDIDYLMDSCHEFRLRSKQFMTVSKPVKSQAKSQAKGMLCSLCALGSWGGKSLEVALSCGDSVQSLYSHWFV